jgi:3'-phosphoadenosine 5'-phosphosulfate sulfotransferase (PAPS reductase)/FAD synthetase
MTSFDDYSKIIVFFSGGKDSIACLLHLLDHNVPKTKIELWHHDVDGQEGEHLMDWPVTKSYCQAVADAFDIPLYFSWKVGGFEREMLRENARTAPTKFETPEGEVIQVGGTRGKLSTRRKFPQVSANLSVRWCSAYLKIDVGAAAIRNQQRFNNTRTLVISGERAEESPARSNYKMFEPDRSDNRNGRTGRHVDRWRPVHKWSESDVWKILERYQVNPHPAYHLGWGRVSCLHCIFANNNQCASAWFVDYRGFQRLVDYEIDFDCTIHRSKSLIERKDQGTPYDMYEHVIQQAMSTTYYGKIIVDRWALPAGAFGDSCGPS